MRISETSKDEKFYSVHEKYYPAEEDVRTIQMFLHVPWDNKKTKQQFYYVLYYLCGRNRPV